MVVWVGRWLQSGKGTGASSDLLSALFGKLLTLCLLGFRFPVCKMRGLLSSFNKIFFFPLSAYFVPGTVLSSENSVVNQTDIDLLLSSLGFRKLDEILNIIHCFLIWGRKRCKWGKGDTRIWYIHFFSKFSWKS